MEFDITRMSSKGQVVIPREMRRGVKEGEKLVIIKTDEQWILKKASKMDEALKKDLEFSKGIKEAWKAYDRGEFVSRSAEDFLKELEKW